MTALPVFDFAAFDADRRDKGLNWYEFADELWQQSSELNAHRSDHKVLRALQNHQPGQPLAAP